MRFPSFATLLIALGASLLLAAFGETSSTPSSSATTTPSATITSPSDPTATATPRYLAPKTEAPAATDAPLQDATPVPPTFRAPIETPVSPVVNNLVFYDQDGVTLEHYWPFDSLRNLSAGETEILACNTSPDTIEFRSPSINFTEACVTKERISGTWEKFSSAASWDRIEYIQIPHPRSEGNHCWCIRVKRPNCIGTWTQ